MKDAFAELRAGRQPVVEVISDEAARSLAAKTGAERLAMTFEMMRFARDMIAAAVRGSHPEWDDEQVAREVAHRFSHGAV